MAVILHVPDPPIHDCRPELDALGVQPLGTVAACSCGSHFQVKGGKWDVLTRHGMDHGRTPHGRSCCPHGPHSRPQVISEYGCAGFGKCPSCDLAVIAIHHAPKFEETDS